MQQLFFSVFLSGRCSNIADTPVHCPPVGSASWDLRAIKLPSQQADGDEWGLLLWIFFVPKYHPNSKVKYFLTWLIVIWESLRRSFAEPSVHSLLLIFPWGKPVHVTVCTDNDLPNRLWMLSGFYLPKISYAKRGPHSNNVFMDPLFFHNVCWVAVIL